MVQLTTHAYDRLKDRTGAKGKQAMLKAQKAFSLGKDIKDFTGNTQKYLMNVLRYSTSHVDTVKVLGTQVFLFANGVCITSFPFPAKVWQQEVQRRKRV